MTSACPSLALVAVVCNHCRRSEERSRSDHLRIAAYCTFRRLHARSHREDVMSTCDALQWLLHCRSTAPCCSSISQRCQKMIAVLTPQLYILRSGSIFFPFFMSLPEVSFMVVLVEVGWWLLGERCTVAVEWRRSEREALYKEDPSLFCGVVW